jgi:hypothetical protein
MTRTVTVNGQLVAIDMRSEELNVPDEHVISVTFGWSDVFGYCYECGCPAAYIIGDVIREPSRGIRLDELRCSVCAAIAASDGEKIEWLFREPA